MSIKVKSSKNLKTMYLVLTIIGAILPMLVIANIVQKTGTFDFISFISVLDSSLYQRLISVDFFITAFVLTFLYFLDFKNLPLKTRFLPIIATFSVGICFGLPLYLYLKELNKVQN